MSVTTQTEPNDNYVEVRLSERITAKDYETFLPIIDAEIARCGRICLLVIMEDFRGWDVETGWEETKFMFSRFSKIDRVGIVGASELQKWMAFFAKPFTMAEVKYFTTDEESEARKWVSDAATKYACDDNQQNDEQKNENPEEPSCEPEEPRNEHEIVEVEEKEEEVIGA